MVSLLPNWGNSFLNSGGILFVVLVIDSHPAEWLHNLEVQTQMMLVCATQPNAFIISCLFFQTQLLQLIV